MTSLAGAASSSLARFWRGVRDLALFGRGLRDLALFGRGVRDLALFGRGVRDLALFGRGLRDTVRLPAWLPYLLRVSAAAVIALYLAFWLQLPTPYSALTTVYIVANPVRGAIVSKSIWRIVGTAVGAVMAIVQTALLGQSPLLFDLFIAVWMGLCCGAASLLRFFTSYGAVLAGYTVVIIDVGVFADPENALTIALFRLSVVVLGIVVTGLVFLLTQRGREPEAFEASIGRLLAEVADLLRRALAKHPNDALRNERRVLAGRITALEQDIVYAGSDNIAVRYRAVALRVAGTRLLGALTSGFHAAERLGTESRFSALFDAALERASACALTDRAAAAAAIEHATAAFAAHRGDAVHLERGGDAVHLERSGDAVHLERGGDAVHLERSGDAVHLERGGDAVHLERGGDAVHLERSGNAVHLDAAHLGKGSAAWFGEPGALDQLSAEEQARDTLERLGRALAVLDDRGGRQRMPRLLPFLDWSGALRNAIRGFLVVALACLGWYVSYAPAGPTLLAYLVPAAALLSTTPSPGMAAKRFAQGSTIGTLVAVTVQACVLPQVTGFPLLMVVLLVTAAPGVALQPSLEWGGAAFAYLVFMNTQIAVTNPQDYSLTGILENGEMYLLGNVALILVFRILLPPDPAKAARNIARSLAASASRLARRRLLPDPLTWENIQLQKILRYGQRLDQMGTPKRSLLMAEATAALILGRIVLQLRLMVRSHALPRAVAAATDASLHNLRHLRHAPLERAAAIELNAVLVAGEAAAMEEAPRGQALRVAALLHEAARLLGENAVYFDRNTTVARIGA